MKTVRFLDGRTELVTDKMAERLEFYQEAVIEGKEEVIETKEEKKTIRKGKK